MTREGQHASDPDHPGAEEGASPEAKFPGKGFKIGEYILDKTLGHGSMATVYLARDATGHEVAVKIFQEGPGVSPTMLERFRREAEAAKKLRRHPNIMKVYATGQEGPYHFIVMEPIRQNRTLEDLLEVTPLTIEEITRNIIRIARALHYAHSRNIVHRDVKPTNIMIDEFGEPLLSDFGVAALIDWPSCTMSGALTGTPLYMSPEQARAERVGPESDIYSLGIVLYEALTGSLPYSAQHSSPVKNVLEAVKSEHPRRPRFYRRDISPDLEAVILKAIEKDPDRRYSDADAFANDLERALAGRHVNAKLFSYWEKVLYLIRRYDQFVAAAVVMLALAGTAGYFFREKLMAVRYEKLLTQVHLRNFASRLTTGVGTDDANQAPGAWHDIRMARRAMSAANWTSARDYLLSAIRYSESIGDQRTAAMATLDLARTETVTGSPSQAVEYYRAILSNPDTSPSVAGLAQLEALILLLLNGDRTEALNILSMHRIPPEGPIHDCILCLSGDITVDEFSSRIAYMPSRLRNDAHFVAAIRHKLDGREREFIAELRWTLQLSSPSTEWPAPFARLIRSGGMP